MNRPTQTLHERGQSIWLDNITRTMLEDGTLQRYIDHYAVTGLTSNPSIFDHAIATGAYDDAISDAAKHGHDGEGLFFLLAIADLQQAADMFLTVHDRTDRVDGWVSLEVSPELAHDTEATVAAALDLHRHAARENLFIKIPGTTEGLPAIEECIAAGVPVNVTLLFDSAQYRAAAEAYMRGVERRVQDGVNPAVASVASVFMSRWDKAVAGAVPEDLRDKLALAVGHDTYRAYRQLQDSERWQRLAGEGARLQRLLWASTSTKDPAAADDLYVAGLAAPLTVNTMPENTLLAFADHGEVGEPMPADGGDCDAVLARFGEAGVDVSALAARLQSDGAASFVEAWKDLISRIETQSEAIQ